MEIIENFGIQPILLLAQVINFAILIFLLKRFLYKPILTVLEQRRKRIEESLKRAEDIEKEYQKMQERRAEIISEANNRAQELIGETKKEAKEILEDTESKAKTQTENILAKGKALIETERVKMKEDVLKEVVNLVVIATSRLTGKILTEEDKRKLTKESIEEINQT
ncbi:MAG: ATP synthase F0 subunit B [Candidatus Woykebacteria bacterium RBG_13_40_7b]|uniref:ATP synthase subunit b n=1 Tax=Candidatus Woykebacteria bacterium RBG_13_40_7b TaxID=1802594 RepID=A0A1G1W871_9BACT|nr:MAG: ATP synthase F0 subunit B [Candidatus Woykebacteria bacterium RBG_13_40_7b]